MVFLASADLNYIGVLDAGIVALLGYVVVFFGLILLMAVVMAIGKIFVSMEKKHAAVVPIAEVAAAADTVPSAVAPGSAGNVMIHDVEPKTAAMLMAIVADKLGKPLNELRFISIKEVK